MAIQNLTTWDLEDPNNVRTVSYSSIIGDDISRLDGGYLSRDYGADYWQQDFTFKLEIVTPAAIDSAVGAWLYPLIVCNTLGDGEHIELDSSSSIGLMAINSAGLMRMPLYKDESTTRTTEYVPDLAWETRYYVTMELDYDGGVNSTGRITLRVYTGNYYGGSGAVEHGTVTLDMSVGFQVQYRYIELMAARGGGGNQTTDYTLENFDDGGFVIIDAVAVPSAEALSDMPEEKSQHGFEELNGILYAVGGTNIGSVHSKTVYGYDIVAGTWSQYADIPVAMQSPILRAVNGKLYLIGGYDSTLPLKYDTVYEYDPDLDTWTLKSPMPYPREDHGSAVVDGKIYIFGGITNPLHTLVPYIDVYDPATDTWEASRSWGTPRCLGDYGVAYQGHIYLVSGTADMSGYSAVFNATTQVDRYDPETDTFVTMEPCPTPKCYKEVVEIGGVFYVVGGNTAGVSDVQFTTEIYDVGLDVWRTNEHILPIAAYGIGCAKYDGDLYFCGGHDGTDWLTAFYKYSPEYMEASTGTGTLTIVSPVPPQDSVTYNILNMQLDIDRS
jgi:hypothetical protein